MAASGQNLANRDLRHAVLVSLDIVSVHYTCQVTNALLVDWNSESGNVIVVLVADEKMSFRGILSLRTYFLIFKLSETFNSEPASLSKTLLYLQIQL